MKPNIEPFYPLLVLLIVFSMIACEQNRNKATIGKDTANMHKDASTILDTAKRDMVQKDSAKARQARNPDSTNHSN
ncbi:hypothetical protein FO440_23590 [Mucilaginibacter corticis]|uniref:Lipoprotein n=1 Tax=Mucilaginibacter corticis TaxID=2597670 RepID=A0A556M7Z4_9SPHI|nr:hypothetical protein [Mucilaginibacter corticis]TSJ35906.1 hypothetical protein FO440_23590 [Mucilaginibacter corticis]